MMLIANIEVDENNYSPGNVVLDASSHVLV